MPRLVSVSRFAAPLLAILALATCASVPTQGMQLNSGEQILAKVCNHCHSQERICNALGDSTSQWYKRIQRMNSHGANLNDAQTQTMASYLAAQKPGSKPVCHE